MKDFQPYSNLWLNTRTWFTRHKAWTEGAWDEIQPEELETTFENVMKAMSQVVRYFKDKGFPKILQNATDMKAKIDEFKPIVPIALSLRKEGMVDRHWDQISKTVGFDIRPDENFTLNTCVEKGLINHTELCEDVGERAYKENHIEKSLNKMQGEWEGLNFALP